MVLFLGTLSTGLTAINGEDTKSIEAQNAESIKNNSVVKEEAETNDNSVKGEALYRNPFSLPTGVKFVEKGNRVSPGFSSENESTWDPEEVASSLSGIFQSGNIVKANINGKWMKKGDWLGEEQIVEIREDTVILIGKEKRTLSLEGVEAELKVNERVKQVSKGVK
jgi:hypothetical protein